MEITTIITLGTILIVCILLYLVISGGKKKKEAKFIAALSLLAEKNNCTITEHESWNNSIIGVDKTRNCLFALRKSDNGDINQTINLADFQKCRVTETNRVISNKESSTKVIDKIELVFSSFDRTKSDAIIEIYNTSYDTLYLKNEAEVAAKWNGIANQVIDEIAQKK